MSYPDIPPAADFFPQYRDDVPSEIEDKIAKAVAGDKGVEVFHRDREKQIKFASIVYWTIQSDHENIADRRKSAQETALDLLDWSDYESPQQTMLHLCGQGAFEGVEYQPVKKHVQNKWQRLFERLVRTVEQHA